MPLSIFGKKLEMTHIFDEEGTSVPVTIVKADPCQVTQIKTKKTEGYSAVQLGYSKKSIERLPKPIQGHLKKSGDIGFQKFGEFHTDETDEYALGNLITVANFSTGQKVSVTGLSIGKGFTGNQKRHNFSRGPMTHGSKNHRLPGSIGAGSTPGRVYPGKKMAGQLGGKVTTIKTSEILFINDEENVLILRGSLPGKKKSFLKISVKD